MNRVELKRNLFYIMIMAFSFWMTLFSNNTYRNSIGIEGEKDPLIIGVTHGKAERELVKSLTKAAKEENIILALEGFGSQDQEIIKETFGSNHMVFGYEDKMIQTYIGALLHYGYVANEMYPAGLIAKSQFLVQISTDPKVKKFWLNYKKEVPELAKTLESFRSVEAKLTKKVSNFYESYLLKAPNKDQVAWLKTFKNLARHYSLELNMGRNTLKAVKEYLNDPYSIEKQNKILVGELNHFREKRMAENLKRLQERALKKGLRLVVVVGKAHTKTLQRLLDVGDSVEGVISAHSILSSWLPDFFPKTQVGKRKSRDPSSV